jgi:very-short-patch-repair endonuclease
LSVTRSVLERRFLKIVRRHKLPLPEVNVMVCGYEVDFFWPEHRLVVETDGGEHHRTRRAFERDRQRDADLQAAGFRPVRFTHRRITREPGWVGKRLEQLLDGFVSPGDTDPSKT